MTRKKYFHKALPKADKKDMEYLTEKIAKKIKFQLAMNIPKKYI